ncbi:MAG: dihydrodipicolinate synthase family protein [Aggregatilineaceae bacterium]
MSATITGIFNILATPFDADRQLDLPSLRRLIEFQLDRGAYGLTILGVLGEAAKLKVDERRLVMDTVMETVNGRVPVVVGVSHQDTATCIALGQAAFAAGAAGVMIAPPHLDDPSDEQVLALYSRIAEAVNGPIVVQDYPLVTNVVLSPDLLATLAERIPVIRYLKMEDPPLMTKIRAIRARTDQLAIFGGLGGMFLLEELQAGAAGTMTGFAFTEVLVATYRAFSTGRLAEAERIFDRYLPLIRFENQPQINLSIRKELLYRRGAIACPVLRDPYVPIDEGTHQEIDWILRRVGISDPTQPLTF